MSAARQDTPPAFWAIATERSVVIRAARIALVVTVVPFLLQLGAAPDAATLAPVLHHDSLPGLAVTLGGALLGPEGVGWIQPKALARASSASSTSGSRSSCSRAA